MSSSDLPIYLDYQTTTPLDPAVRSAMERYLDWDCGDPTSEHVLGRSAAYAVDLARTRVAALLGARAGSRIVFTSSGAESLALALAHGASYLPGVRDRVIMTTLDAPRSHEWRQLAPADLDIVSIPPDDTGKNRTQDIANAIDERTFAIVASLAHGDTGTLQDIEALTRVAHEHGLLSCVDVSRGAGHVPLHVTDTGIDLAILASHRLCGPRGVAALYVSRELVDGGWCHGALGSTMGTRDVPEIVGFGVAADIARHSGASEAVRIRALGDRLVRGLRDANLDVTSYGGSNPRVPGYLALHVPDLDEQARADLVRHVALATRSCYSADGHDASPLLMAMGVSDTHAAQTVYVGIGRFTRDTDIDAAVAHIVTVADESARRRSAPAQDAAVVVNCEGKAVPASGAGYTQFCALSNTANFLQDLGQYAIAPITRLGRPARISIVIPSHASGAKLGDTIASLLAQAVPLETEIIVFINEAPDAPSTIRDANDAALAWLSSVLSGATDSPDAFAGYDVRVRAALDRAQGRIRVHAIRHVMEGGIPVVYQTAMSSFIQRAREFVDGLGGGRARQLQELDEICDRTLLLFCDDDIQLTHTDALARAYYDAVVHESVVLGQWRRLLDADERASSVKRCALRLMECFLAIKYDLGVNALPPKGLLLRHVLEGGAVTLNDGFGDQLYFARLASDRSHHALDVTTSIEEADYASNGRMLRDLRLFLDGADNGALNIFENLKAIAARREREGRYVVTDIETLIERIASRDVSDIHAYLDDLGDLGDGKGRLQ